ncbi:MAG: glycosyltransferase family 4 protein [Rhizobiaceae bacterium]
MNNPSILVDGSHLLKRGATGIGSYAHSLTKSLGALGAEVSVFFGHRAKTIPSDPPIALADQVFGQNTWRRSNLSLVARTGLGFRRRIKTDEVDIDGLELDALDPPLPPFVRVFNGQEAFLRADIIFALRQQFGIAELPDEFAAAHWTGPFPIKARHGPNIYTLHDLVPLQFPYFVEDGPGNSARVHAAIAQQADHIITVSETSKAHIVDILGVPAERVSVTYQPVQEIARMPQEGAERLVSTIYAAEPGKYALFLGAIEPKKNLKRLIEAFSLSGVEIPLLLAGPLGWLYDEELELIDVIRKPIVEEGLNAVRIAEAYRSIRKIDDGQQNIEDSIFSNRSLKSEMPIRRLGYLPRRHVVALMQCARFFVFPSVYEGFGLPALEAMHLGVPVLTSRRASLPEVVGDAAILVDPISISEIADGIRRLDADADLRSELARRGPIQAAAFSEDAYLEKLAAAYGKVGISFPAKSAVTPIKEAAAE